MELFAIISTSFPTAIYTMLLVITCMFWLVAMLGVLDLEVMDADIDLDLDGGTDTIGGFSGILIKLKLDGVPVTISLSILILCGWTFSYFLSLACHLTLPSIQWVHILSGIITIPLSFILSLPLTTMLIRPLKPLFKKVAANDEKSLIGKTGVVRTSRVSHDFGEALVDLGSNELIIRIRADENLNIKRNDTIVLLEYIESVNAYTVVLEKDLFNS